MKIKSMSKFIFPTKNEINNNQSPLLTFGFWNIQGFKSQTLGNKTKLREVVNTITKYDVFGLVETHANNKSDLEIKDYTCYIQNRESNNSKSSGGIAI